MTYISALMMGGLGNQMFQIAIVYALSYENKINPIFEKILDSPSVFKNRPVYFDNLFKKINTINTEQFNNIKFIKHNELQQKYYDLQLNFEKSYFLNGYFQSPKFFDKYRNQIINLFSLDDIVENNIKNIYNNIKKTFNKTISLHVRHGDYLKLSHFHTVQTIDYYENALKHFDENDLIIVFSDDIPWCKNNIKSKNIHFIENVYCKNIPNDVLEMKIMSNCDYHIIANSSYSWWGAYLSNNEKVIAPQSWFVNKKNNDNFKDIYCDHWIVI